MKSLDLTYYTTFVTCRLCFSRGLIKDMVTCHGALEKPPKNYKVVKSAVTKTAYLMKFPEAGIKPVNKLRTDDIGYECIDEEKCKNARNKQSII